jgi:large subunit ribosomal protein L32e
MSKRFKRQDYFRYKRLGTKWRRPVGWQSKLRNKKGGAGLKVNVGYGSPGKTQPVLVYNVNDLSKDTPFVFIAAGVGSKKALVIAEKAKELGLTVCNMKKVRKAKRVKRAIEKAKTRPKKEEKKEAKKAEHAHSHEGHEHHGHKDDKKEETE